MLVLSSFSPGVVILLLFLCYLTLICFLPLQLIFAVLAVHPPGVFDVMSNEEVVETLRTCLILQMQQHGQSAEKAVGKCIYLGWLIIEPEPISSSFSSYVLFVALFYVYHRYRM